MSAQWGFPAVEFAPEDDTSGRARCSRCRAYLMIASNAYGNHLVDTGYHTACADGIPHELHR